MTIAMANFNRRDFLKASGFTTLPVILPASFMLDNNVPPADEKLIKFYGDGESSVPGIIYCNYPNWTPPGQSTGILMATAVQ